MSAIASLPTTLALVLAAATEPSGAVEDCLGAVNEHYAGGRYRDAAAMAERCWVESREPSLLLFAAQARVNLGHGGHAAAQLLHYVQGESGAWRDPMVEELFTAARALVVSVEVTVTPAPVGDGELAAVYLGERRGVLRFSGAELRAQESQIFLDPGRWRLAWRENHRTVASKEIEAVEGLRVVLEVPPVHDDEVPPRPTSPGREEAVDRTPEPRRPQRGAAIGVASAAAVSAGIGAGLLARSARIKTDPLSGYGSAAVIRANAEAIVDRAMFGWNGAALLGVGLGAGAVAAGEAAGGKRTALYAELGSGGAALIVGIAWSLINTQGYYEDSEPYRGVSGVGDVYGFDRRYRHEIGSGLFLGLGSGLVSGAAIALITRAVAERRRR